MNFPFKIIYRKKLSGEIEKFTTIEILDFAYKDFEKSGAQKVYKNENSVVGINPIGYIGMRPGLNFNRWSGISKVSFEIIQNKDSRIAKYSFSTIRILIFALSTGLFFGFTDSSLIFGLIAFGVIMFLLWGGKLLQHWIVFDGTFGDLIYERKHLDKINKDLLN